MTQTAPQTALDELHEATAVYTAEAVINSLLDRIGWPNSPGRLLDPSAGDGAFLIEALRRLDLSNPANLTRVIGWEIHPEASAAARTAIASYLEQKGFTENEASELSHAIVVNRDFLTHGPHSELFEVIAGNPPYLRFQRLPSYFQTLYLRKLPPYARGDLLHGFLDSCANLLTQNGKMALVCSDRFLFNCTAANLRQSLGQRVGISHIARLDKRTAFYRPKRRVRNSPPRIHPVEIIFRPSDIAPFRISEIPISPDTLTSLDTNSNERTLSAIAKVSLAPWLGPEGIFVIDSTAAALLKGNAELIPCVDTDDIDALTDELQKPSRFAIRTYKDRQPSPELARHLKSQLTRMPPRGQRKTYWLPPETINLALNQPSLLIPRIAKRLRAVTLPSGVLPINHNLSIVSAQGAALNEIKKILLAEKSQTWIKLNAPRLENGYFSITTKLLRRMPI